MARRAIEEETSNPRPTLKHLGFLHSLREVQDKEAPRHRRVNLPQAGELRLFLMVLTQPI
jgi:hypothetical protein